MLSQSNKWRNSRDVVVVVVVIAAEGPTCLHLTGSGASTSTSYRVHHLCTPKHNGSSSSHRPNAHRGSLPLRNGNGDRDSAPTPRISLSPHSLYPTIPLFPLSSNYIRAQLPRCVLPTAALCPSGLHSSSNASDGPISCLHHGYCRARWRRF